MRPWLLATVGLFAILGAGLRAEDETSRDARPISAPFPEYPADMLDKGTGGQVELIVRVETDGSVRDVRTEHATDVRLAIICEAALRKWKFEPARYFGRRTGDDFPVKFKFESGNVSVEVPPDPHLTGVPPKVLTQVSPEYPRELVNSRNRGSVEIAFIVDREGNVREPLVLKSTHPLLESPAVQAVMKWKFQPATVDGRPVNTRMVAPMIFEFHDDAGVESFSIKKNREKKGVNALGTATPPKPRTTVFAVHPYKDAVARKGGFAEVKCVIGPGGNVLATEVLSASKPEFGLALGAAMEAWTFEPARDKEKRVPISLSRKVKFEIGERDSAIDSDTTAIAARIRKGRFAPAKANELDAPLKPSFTTPPAYPTAFNAKQVAGSATIEVIVDKKGRAVLPRIIEASAPEFGWAAATAVQRWRFDPPTVGGKPVETKVVIPMRFTPQAPPTEPTEGSE
jgi:TonB family protein